MLPPLCFAPSRRRSTIRLSTVATSTTRPGGVSPRRRPTAPLATAEALDDLDDRFTALLRLSDAFTEAAAAVVELVAAHPHAGALVVDAGPSPAVSRRLAAAIAAIGDGASMARAVEALATVVPRAEVPNLVALLTAMEDPALRLPGLDALVHQMPAAVRRRVARDELSRREEWLLSRWGVVLGTRVIARCEPQAAEALVPEAWATIREFQQREDRARAAVLLAEALDDVVDAELLEDVLPLDIDVMPALIRWLDRDGVLRVRAALPELAPSYRHHEIVAALARRALAVHDDRLAIECLTEPDVYRIEEAVAAIADALPQHLIQTASELAGTDDDALGALARRAARLGDGNAALALVDRAADHYRADMLAELAPIIPAEALPPLLERARSAGYGSGRALVAVLPRVTRAERRHVLLAAVAACADFRMAMADTRVRLLHELTPELARLPAAQLAGLFGEMLRQSAERNREEVLCDIRGFAPAFLRRFGPGVASALDDAIWVAGGDRWP